MKTALRDASRRPWWVAHDPPTLDEINCGALLRIADAIETMAGSYRRLIEECDLYKQQHERELVRRESLKRSNAALRGVIKRNKRKAGQA